MQPLRGERGRQHSEDYREHDRFHTVPPAARIALNFASFERIVGSDTSTKGNSCKEGQKIKKMVFQVCFSTIKFVRELLGIGDCFNEMVGW